MNHVAVDVGEASLETVVIKGQPLVVEAKKVQDRGVQIVDGGDVLLSLPAKQIRCTVCVTALDASTGKPSGEAVGIVVAAAGPLKSGMRPNSVHQTTSVSSSRPRCFRSRNRAAAGWSSTGPCLAYCSCKPCGHPSY